MSTRPILAVALALACLLGDVSASRSQVLVEAYSGNPFGVGRISLTPSVVNGAVIDPLSDDRFAIVEKDGRALYPAVGAAPVRRILRQFLNAQGPGRTSLYFLFTGTEPLQLTLYTPSPQALTVRPRNDPRFFDRTLQAWWRDYARAPRRLLSSGEYPPIVENYLTSTLSRRLGLPMPGRVLDSLQGGLLQGDSMNSALGLLTGAESIRAAMQKTVLLEGIQTGQQANQPLPPGVAPPEIPFPEHGEEVKIEPIAMHVPQECFYVRFGNFTNYLWLRGFLDQWGGDLRNMISVRGLDYGLNKKLERQIALKETALAKVLGPTIISDVAMIGHDTFMREGAAFGILFEARSNEALQLNFAAQRREALNKEEGSSEEIVKIAGRNVSFISTPDNRLRSFYAIDGDYHLVTTSRSVVERFFEAGKGVKPLGASREFRHARAIMPETQQHTVFAYLSDAFFRQMVSPAFRVEMTRRMQSMVEIEAIQLARLAAKAEGKEAQTIEQLIAANLLPRNFGQRADGSRLVFSEAGVVDSLRGGPGTFVPVSDVKIEKVTASEVQAYQRFAADYVSQWERMDPVVAGISRKLLNKEGLERMTIDLRMAPMAKSRYGMLAGMVGAPTRRSVAPVKGDLASLQMVASGQGLLGFAGPGGEHHLQLGVRDFALPFLVNSGEVQPDQSRLALFNGYLASWPRPGWLSYLGLASGAIDARGFAPLDSKLGWKATVNDFLAISFNRGVLEEVTPQLRMVEAQRPAQIRLRVEDLTGTKLSQGVSAMGYMRAHQASSSGGHLLNALSDQLHLPPEQGLEVAEKLLAGQLACPLGGKYHRVKVEGGLERWTSSALLPGNRFALTNVPEDYELALLSWFRGLSADLNLNGETLSAHIELDMQLAPEENGVGFTFPTLPGFSLPQNKKPIPEEIPAPPADN